MTGIITFLIGTFFGSVATMVVISLCEISKEMEENNDGNN